MQKFKKRFVLAAIGSSFALAPAVHAASNTFDGNDFTVSYGVSNSANPANGSSSDFFTTSSVPVTGSASSAEITDLAGWKIDTAGNSLTLTWAKLDKDNDGDADEFMNFGTPAFIGFKISDTGGELSDILGVSVTNTAYTPLTYGNLVEGFEPSKVTFDANDIYVNLNLSMWHAAPMASMGDPYRDEIALSVDFAPPIPEPETYAMLLAGLGLMGAVVRRRKAADKAA